MSESPDAARLLEAAEQAARTDDLALADELLRRAAHIQEAELGPLHPALANTFNNLAIVAERTARLDQAETFYRRAVAITSASLPPDDPFSAASRENLEDFCRAHGLPIDRAHGLPIDTPTEVRTVDAPLANATPQPSMSPLPVPKQPPPSASEPRRSASRTNSPSLAWVAIGIVVVAAVTFLFMRRPSSSREAPTTAPTTELAAQPQGAERALPPRAEPPVAPSPVQETQPAAVPQNEDRGGPPSVRTAQSPSSDAITLATAQLCRTFSTAGATWRCDPIVDPASRGRLVLYTRVRSPRDAVVVHRWYQGDTLRQSVKLPIRANATEGYRTYSQQTVDNAADWRVEVSSADGDLLHAQRFAVR